MSEQQKIEQAAALLQQGKLVAFPTETVYGLGGNALSDKAVAAIYAAKGRPSFNPLIVHVDSLEEASRYAEFNENAIRLARAFWPGPLTLVLPRTSDCALSLLVSAGSETIALRVPAHPLAQALLQQSELPIAAPSANRSGRISPTEAAHVEEELGDRIAMILDGGPCEVGIESTVVNMTNSAPIILRPGSISAQDIMQVVPLPFPPPLRGEGGVREELLSPGMLASHYAPNLPVRLNATEVAADEALLAFGPSPLAGAKYIQNLSQTGNLQEAAANLFRMLRLLDREEVRRIAVMPLPEEGDAQALGIAINDRLKRAAEPR